MLARQHEERQMTALLRVVERVGTLERQVAGLTELAVSLAQRIDRLGGGRAGSCRPPPQLERQGQRPGRGEQPPPKPVQPGDMYAHLQDLAVRCARAGMNAAATERALLAEFDTARVPGASYSRDDGDTRRLAKWTAESRIAERERTRGDSPPPGAAGDQGSCVDDTSSSSREGCHGVRAPMGGDTVTPPLNRPQPRAIQGCQPPRDTVTAPATAAGVDVLRELDVEALLATPPPPVPWVLEPMLVEGCVTMLAGREGRGKSMLALAAASALGRGELLLDVAGMRTGVGGLVLYVDAENGEREIHRRLHGLDVRPAALVYVEADGFNLAGQMPLLELLVDKHRPRVVVLDSLRSLAPGLDENDSQEVETVLRPLARLAQRLGIAILILHHASRSSGEYRGSTAIGAAVELGFTLRRHDDDPMSQARRQLSCWKSRPAPEPADRWLTIKAGEDGGILIFEAAAYEPERPAPARDEIERALSELIAGCQVSPA